MSDIIIDPVEVLGPAEDYVKQPNQKYQKTDIAHIPPWVRQGVHQTAAVMDVTRMSAKKAAGEWGISLKEFDQIRADDKVAIEEIRESSISRNLLIAQKAQQITMDKLSDDLAVKDMTAKDAASISKMATDTALNLANGQVGAPTTINFRDLNVAMMALTKK